MVEALFDSGSVIKKNGDDIEEITIADAMKDVKLVGIYFSMHNCAPCRSFTPKFVALYNEVNESEKVLEVIFVSGDKTQDEFVAYYGEMPWLALPRADSRLAKLAKEFDVKGVPRLVILKPDGTVVDKNAV
jgi:nucleoredoxin